MKNQKVWGTDNKWYTIAHRKKGETRCYSFGYRTEDLEMLRQLARKETNSGEYRCVKIVNADSGDLVECFTKATR